jgi:hypothetical protein
MKTPVTATPFWSTASFGDSVHTSPMELTALGEHLDRCRGSRGRLFKLHCMAESVNGIVAPRFMTTLVVVTVLIGVSSLAV